MDLSGQLLKASQDLDVEKVQELLEAGANPNVQDKQGQTPLRKVTFIGSYPRLRALHLDIEGPDVLDTIREKAVDIARMLLENGADPSIPANANTVNENFPLLIASKSGFTPMVQLLLNYGADVNQRKSTNNTTPLIVASGEDGNLDIVNLLLEAGADINAQDKYGTTPIEAAVSWDGKRNDILERMLEVGADANTYNRFYGNNLLMLASMQRNVGAVKILLEAGADVTVETPDGETALDMAIKRNDKPIIRLLSEALLHTPYRRAKRAYQQNLEEFSYLPGGGLYNKFPSFPGGSQYKRLERRFNRRMAGLSSRSPSRSPSRSRSRSPSLSRPGPSRSRSRSPSPSRPGPSRARSPSRSPSRSRSRSPRR